MIPTSVQKTSKTTYLHHTWHKYVVFLYGFILRKSRKNFYFLKNALTSSSPTCPATIS